MGDAMTGGIRPVSIEAVDERQRSLRPLSIGNVPEGLLEAARVGALS